MTCVTPLTKHHYVSVYLSVYVCGGGGRQVTVLPVLNCFILQSREEVNILHKEPAQQTKWCLDKG